MESGLSIRRTVLTSGKALDFVVGLSQCGGTDPQDGLQPGYQCDCNQHCPLSVPVHSSATHQRLRWLAACQPLIIILYHVLRVADLSLTTALSPFSPRSNTSRWASSYVLIEPSPIALRHIVDSPSSFILPTFSCLAAIYWTFLFTTVSTMVEAVVGTLWTAYAHKSREKSTRFLYSQDAGTLATRSPRHLPRSQAHMQSDGIVQNTHCKLLAWLHNTCWLVDCSLVRWSNGVRSSMSAMVLCSGWMPKSSLACLSAAINERLGSKPNSAEICFTLLANST